MAWLARDFDGTLNIYSYKPVLHISKHMEIPYWVTTYGEIIPIRYNQDMDEKIIGKHITWEDEPVEI